MAKPPRIRAMTLHSRKPKAWWDPMGQYTGGELGRSDPSMDATNPDVPSIGVPLPGKQENDQTRNDLMNLLMLLGPAAAGVGGRAGNLAQLGAGRVAPALEAGPAQLQLAAEAGMGNPGMRPAIDFGAPGAGFGPQEAPPWAHDMGMSGLGDSSAVDAPGGGSLFGRPPIDKNPGSLLRGQRARPAPTMLERPSSMPQSMTPSSPLSVGDFADGLSGPPYWNAPTLPPGGAPGLGAGPSPRLLGPGGGSGALAQRGPMAMGSAGDASLLSPPGPSPVAPRAGLGNDDPILQQILRHRAAPTGALGAGADGAPLSLPHGPLPPGGPGAADPSGGLPPWLLAGLGAGTAAGGAGLLLGRQGGQMPWTRKPVRMPGADDGAGGADPLSLLMDFPPLADATGGGSTTKPRRKLIAKQKPTKDPSGPSGDALATSGWPDAGGGPGLPWPNRGGGAGMFGYPAPDDVDGPLSGARASGVAALLRGRGR